MKPFDIIIDIMLRYGRPLHEQELLCQLALRSGMGPAEMYNSAVTMRANLQELAKFGYIQQEEVNYTILPLNPKKSTLHSLERLDYVLLSEAYMEAMKQQSADERSDELCNDIFVRRITEQDSMSIKHREQTKPTRPIIKLAKCRRPLNKTPKRVGRKAKMFNNIKAPPEMRAKRKFELSVKPSTSIQIEAKQSDHGKQRKSNCSNSESNMHKRIAKSKTKPSKRGHPSAKAPKKKGRKIKAPPKLARKTKKDADCDSRSKSESLE